MADEITNVDQQPGASPWPIFVVLGLALSEIGVFLGIRPISVGGLLLFVSTVAGSLRESGNIVRPERAVGLQGGVLLGTGLTLITINQTGTTVRGQSITIAGAISLLAVLLWLAYARR